METIGGLRKGGKMAAPTANIPTELAQTLAHHDAAISNLGTRMSGVENGLQKLQGDVNKGFNDLSGKIEQLNARPKFDFHQTTTTTLNIFLIVGLLLGVVFWINRAELSAVVAEQKGVNSEMTAKVDRIEAVIAELAHRVGWVGTVKPNK